MTPLTAPASIPAPATPRPLQTASWILDPTGYMRTNRRRFGDLFRVALTPGESSRTLMVSEPKALQQMLSSDSGRSFSAPGDVNELLVTLLGRQSVILLSGQAHRQRRQLVMPHFHGDILAGYERAMETITQEELGFWPVGDVRSVRSVMQTITLRIILQVVFGLERGERAVALRHLLSRRLEMTATPLTSAVFFLVVNTSKLPVYASLGMIRWPYLQAFLLLFPLVFVGAFAGRRFFAWIPQRAFHLAVLALTAAASASLLLF